jgi:cbb3-type cytochrome oxidase maturation protein
MGVLWVLIPLGLALCALAVWAFFWAVDDGQFDAFEADAVRPLEEDSSGATAPAPAPSAPGARRTGSPSSP